MSISSYMEKLLDGVEVEWKPLEDVAEFRRGSFPQPYGNSEWYDGEGSMPFVQVVDLLDDSFELKEITKQRISKKAQPKSVFVRNGTVIVTLQGTIGRVALTQYDCYVDRTLAIFTNYIECINKKYFAYQLKSKFEVEKKNARGSTLKTITKAEFSKFQIPIPCPDNPEKSLAIQAEIVRILDAFTAMTAELTAELNMRKKQYNYYRDQLLSFEEGEVEWKTLGEVFNIFAGGDKPKDAFSEEETDEFNVPILSNGIGLKSLYGRTNIPKITEPSLTVSARGTIGWTSYRDRPFFPIIRLLVLTPKIGVNTKYAYYYMKTIENNYPVPPAGIPQLTKPMIENVQFPIPYPNDPERSQAEQARIVAILDKFDALTNSITEGLPREIELRQKQYEYYRDLLLSFPASPAGGPKSHSDEAA